MPDVSVLEVRLHGRPIGSLTLLQGDRTVFSFADAYVEDENRPTLSLSFKDPFGGLVTDIRSTQRVVPPFFSNLLPEGPLRRYLAERASVSEQREFFLLWALGKDLPGALSVGSADGAELPPATMGDDSDQRRARTYRFSLAGVQLKFSALSNGGKRGGLTIPAQGVDGSWIVKLPSQKFSRVPENEFSMMRVAALMGMNVPDIRLVELDDIANLPGDIGEFHGSAFAIRRFDRSDEGAIHIEDFAQVFGLFPERKYEKRDYRSIASVLAVETDDGDVSEYFRRLVFSTLIGNGDMHLKNWSLIYPDGRTPMLAPAYDMLSTLPYINDTTAALNYGRTKSMAQLSTDELRYMAAKSHLSENLVITTARETVERFRQVWEAEKSHLPLPAAVVEIVDRHAQTVALYRGE